MALDVNISLRFSSILEDGSMIINSSIPVTYAQLKKIQAYVNSELAKYEAPIVDEHIKNTEITKS